jgi:fumarate hydratase class II
MLGTLDLHVGMPVMAHNVLESTRLLGRACTVLAERCVSGLEANVERCGELIEQSLAMCTSLAPLIGYDQAAAIAKEAFESGQTVRQVALAKKLLSAAELDAALDPSSMTQPRA